MKKAHKEGLTLKASTLKFGYVMEQKSDEWVRSEDMVGSMKKLSAPDPRYSVPDRI